MKRSLCVAIANDVDRYNRNDKCDTLRNKAARDLENWGRDYLPYGSGFDAGCYVWIEKSTRNKIILLCDFHHMNDVGYYIGWTRHKVIVTPDLAFGFNLRVTGENKRGIKDYIGDVVYDALSQLV